MFKNKPIQVDGNVDTLIGPQVVIEGDFHFSGGLYIEGRVVGRVLASDDQKSTLTLAENGSIEGEVRAPVVVVNGRVDGDIHAGERVELAARARVTGDVHYRIVEMVAGAVITGRLLHAEAAVAAADGDADAGEDARTRLSAVGS